jgi:glycosyltransferase involved in cell wall biosynthesis
MPDVVLPVLDEAESLPWVLSRMPEGFHPIVVDNGSTDGSQQIARSLNAHVVVEPRRGFGAACWRGLTTSASDIVCFMDCDGSLDPRALPSIVRPLQAATADLVLGARRPKKGAWPLHARLANRCLSIEVWRRTGHKLADIGPMRAAGRDDLLSLGVQDRRSGWPFEMVLRAIDAGWRVTEVAVPYRKRSGRSKVTGTVKGTATAIWDMARVLR